MRDFLLCVVAAIAVAGGILVLASVPGITHAWYSFVFFTVLLAAILAKLYWRVRRRARLWGLLAVFLAIHVAAYAVLLHYVPTWPAFWYIVTGPVEIMLFAVICKAWLNVLPTTVKF